MGKYCNTVFSSNIVILLTFYCKLQYSKLQSVFCLNNQFTISFIRQLTAVDVF